MRRSGMPAVATAGTKSAAWRASSAGRRRRSAGAICASVARRDLGRHSLASLSTPFRRRTIPPRTPAASGDAADRVEPGARRSSRTVRRLAFHSKRRRPHRARAEPWRARSPGALAAVTARPGGRAVPGARWACVLRAAPRRRTPIGALPAGRGKRRQPPGRPRPLSPKARTPWAVRATGATSMTASRSGSGAGHRPTGTGARPNA